MFTFSYYKMTSPLQNLAILHYVACVYDSEWRIGILLSLDHEERDCQIKFVYQTRFTCSFKWSPQDDVCWLPETLLFPTPVIGTGRKYAITVNDAKILNIYMSNI